MPSSTNDNSSTLEYLNLLAKGRFWGSATLKFEGGTIVHVKLEQSLKPCELSGKTEVAPCIQDPIHRAR
jgi:hypothetical protein